MRLSDRKWDDLRYPVTTINPQGGASDPDKDGTDGTLLFAATGTELVYIFAQMPHTYAEYTPIVPHVHWCKTTAAAGDVVWELGYKVTKIGEVRDAAWTTLTTSSTVGGTPDTDEAEKHLISSFGEVFISDFGISDCLTLRLSRLGSDAGDTYGADAKLFEFDIHHLADGDGSAGEFYKVWRKGTHS